MNNIRPNGAVTKFLHEKPGCNLKKYFKHFDEALNSNKSTTKQIDRYAVVLVDYLDEYVVESFKHEEEAMNCCEYDEKIIHMEDHTRFIFAFSIIKKNLGRDNNVGAIYEGLRSLVDRWMVDHVNNKDLILYNHVKRNALGISLTIGKSNFGVHQRIKIFN